MRLAFVLFLSLSLSSLAAPKKKTEALIQVETSAAKPLTGDILDKATRNLLFKFERVETPNETGSQVVRTFSYPDGRVVAVEKLDYKNGKLARFQLTHNQLNADGFWEIKEDKKLFFSYTKENKTKTDEEDLAENLVATDQIVGVLQKNWSKLESGEKLKIRLPVIDRRETVGFEFEKEGKESIRDGKPVITIEMSPSSFVIAALVKPIYFTFEKNGDHRCLEVDGRTVPKLEVDGKLKDLDAILKMNF